MANIRERLKLGVPENEFERALELELVSAWYELSEIINNGMFSGTTEDVAVAKVGGGTRTLHFEYGLYTGYTDS
jgi:hypothetical protein